MPENVGYPGLFGIPSLDPRSAEARLREKRLSNQTNLINQGLAIAGPSAADRTAATLGAQVAGALGNKFAPQQLNPDEQRQVAIQDQGKAAFAEELAKAKAEGRTPSLEEQNMMLYSSMAKSALENGDINTFQQVAQQAQQMALNNRLTQAKIAELEGKNAPAARMDQVRGIVNEIYTKDQVEGYQEAFLLAEGYNRVVSGVSQAFEDVIKMGEDPSLITQNPGGILGALQNAETTIRQLPSIVGNVFQREDINEDGEVRQGADSLSIDDMAARFNIRVPDVITGSRERAKYKSLMIQLAYQQWRAQEGSGARQASDQDIERALSAIGANQSDARVVAGVLRQSHRNATEKFLSGVQQQYTSAGGRGLLPDEIDAIVYGVRPSGWEQFYEDFQTGQERLGSVESFIPSRTAQPNTVTTASGATIEFID